MTLPATLTGPRIELRPLAATDAAALVAAAADGALWNSPYTVVPSASTVDDYIREALEGQAQGTVQPFVTVLRASGEVIGATRFWKIDRRHRKLEIGSTWPAAHVPLGSGSDTIVKPARKIIPARPFNWPVSAPSGPPA